jgi:chemotaxis signal transduction protein
VEIDNAFIGINVDDVDAVVHVPSSAVEFPTGLTDKVDMIYGFAKLQDYLLILLDIRALFSSEVMEEIAEQSADQ